MDEDFALVRGWARRNSVRWSVGRSVGWWLVMWIGPWDVMASRGALGSLGRAHFAVHVLNAVTFVSPFFALLSLLPVLLPLLPLPLLMLMLPLLIFMLVLLSRPNV